MKKGIHPQYHQQAKVSCACGNTFTTGSTLAKINVDICSNCHPFFTGKMKFIDTMGRVEKFQKQQAQAKKNHYLKKSDRKKIQNQQQAQTPQTLKEMIESQTKKAKKSQQ